MLKNLKVEAALWRRTAIETLETAKHLRDREDHRSCVSRAYYAAYQAVTSVCILHGDAVKFPTDWNNPSHQQLPELIGANGDLSPDARRKLKTILKRLRDLREDADYRMGTTVDDQTTLAAILGAEEVFKLLEIKDGNT